MTAAGPRVFDARQLQGTKDTARIANADSEKMPLTGAALLRLRWWGTTLALAKRPPAKAASFMSEPTALVARFPSHLRVPAMAAVVQLPLLRNFGAGFQRAPCDRSCRCLRLRRYRTSEDG